MPKKIDHVMVKVGFVDSSTWQDKMSYAEFKTKFLDVPVAHVGVEWIFAVLVPVRIGAPDANIFSWTRREGWCEWRRQIKAPRYPKRDDEY